MYIYIYLYGKSIEIYNVGPSLFPNGVGRGLDLQLSTPALRCHADNEHLLERWSENIQYIYKAYGIYIYISFFGGI